MAVCFIAFACLFLFAGLVVFPVFVYLFRTVLRFIAAPEHFIPRVIEFVIYLENDDLIGYANGRM